MLKKTTVTLLFSFALTLTLSAAARAESLEEMKAQIRQQVKSQYEPAARPKAAADTVRAKAADETSKRTAPRRPSAPFSFGVEAVTGLKLAFLMIFFGLAPAAVAKIKGRSFVAWWTLGSLFFIFALPASLIMKPLKGFPGKKIPHPEQPKAAGVTPEEPPPEPAPEPGKDEGPQAVTIYQMIEQLALLKQKGVLTDDEFKAKKNELLGRI